MKSFITVLILVSFFNVAKADTLVIGIDLSDSSPLTLEDAAAARAGKTAASKIETMKRGDTIMLRSFGLPGVTKTQIHETVKITGRYRVNVAMNQIESFIASLPKLVRDGKISIENRTNAIGWLERSGPTLECRNETTNVLMLSDGIEWSEGIKGSQILKGTPLPPPSMKILDGCHVEMWGMGQQQRKFGNDDRWYPVLRKTWTQFMNEAGVASFKGYAVYSR